MPFHGTRVYSNVGREAMNKTYLCRRIPPHLSMDDYATWVMECLKDITPEQARRQKELEERIEKPFTLYPATQVPNS